MISELVSGASAAAVVGPLAVWLGKVWAARILDKDRVRYQTQMETVLQELRTGSSKELYVHQLQFEKEFQVYLELWKEALALSRAAAEFRELKMDSGRTEEDQRQAFVEAHRNLNRRVFDHRPFYAPEVYALAREILRPAGQVYAVRSVVGRIDQDTWKHTEQLLDQVNAAIEPLCDAIRRRIWRDRPEGKG